MGLFRFSRRLPVRLGRLGLVVQVALLALCLGTVARADELASAIYVRTDTDHTTVVSPQVRAKLNVTEATSVDVTYLVDVWTSASIDIVTSATKQGAISEQRDELDVGLSHDIGDLTLSGGYRFSMENDYRSHGGNLGASLDFADNAATLAGSVSLTADTVGRVGDPEFERALTTVSTRLSFTQVLDPSTLLQGTYELGHSGGYQASPYRFVPIGGDGTCAGNAPLCVPERTPDSRLRNSMVVQGRRAFGSSASVGLGYRFYFDDWSVTSHTVQAQASWLPNDFTTLALRYRYYSQGSAEFYKPQYSASDIADDFVTFDRELSALSSHRLGVDYEGDFELGNGEMLFKGILTVGGTHYIYDEFLWLTNVTALEITVSLGLEL
jgi:hypothetical protein